MKRSQVVLSIFFLAMVTLAGCKKEPGDKPGSTGAVYIMNNSPAGNHVIAFIRDADGSLSSGGTYPTAGKGSGEGLGSQGAIIIYNSYLYACNAGSNEITVFKITPEGLKWVDKVASHGIMPVSLTVHKDLLYVLNAGKDGKISGFRIHNNGHLAYMPGSERAVGSGGAQVEFSPSGTQLVVTQKPDNLIYTFQVNSYGLPGNGTAHPSAGETPFGFGFTKEGILIVTEAFGGAVNKSAVSSYQLKTGGNLNVVTAAAPTHQTAACWLAITRDGRFCYATNTGSASVSGYKISNSGALTLIDANGVTGVTGARPLDLYMDKESKYVYTLNSGAHTISIFRIANNGGLTSLGDVSGIPATAAGLTAW